MTAFGPVTTSRKCILASITFVGVAVLAACCWPLRAQETPAENPSDARAFAFLMGNEEYKHVRPLQFISNDIREFSQTLYQVGDYEQSNICEMVDTVGEETDHYPSCANVKAMLPAWLAKAGPEDRMLVGFTGHGFLDRDSGELYLAPIDFKTEQPASTGISIKWLRDQMAQCKAGFKLLVIDACHAGSDKGDDESVSVSAKDLAAPFEDVPGVITLASSTAEEKSWIWPDKKQSVFSYWLNQGLKGHADKDGDSDVDIDELYDYVHANVPYVVDKIFDKPQHPVRFIGPKIVGVPVVIRPAPHTLKGLLDDMAEQLTTIAELKGIKAIGVPEFAVDAKSSELVLGADFGVLGRYCAEELEGLLADRASRLDDGFQVVAHDALQEAVRAKGLGPQDLRTQKVKELEVGGTRPALVQGILRSRMGRVITLQSSLIGTDDLQIFGRTGGTAKLNDQEYVMLGQSPSTPIPPEVYVPDAPKPNQPAEPVIDKVTRWLDENSRGPHPLLDPAYPYQVKVFVDGKECEQIVKDNKCYVGFRKGDVYKIRIVLGEELVAPIFLQLFVDGRNTLPEPAPSKAVFVDPTVRLLPAQRVNPTEAKAWKLEPTAQLTYGVRGFYSKTGEDARYNEFLVGEAPKSLGARTSFDEELGVITAAFYSPKTAPKGMITQLGKDRQGKTGKYKPTELGNLRGVVQIHYVDAATLETAAEDSDN